MRSFIIFNLYYTEMTKTRRADEWDCVMRAKMSVVGLEGPVTVAEQS
jgi:hypothetical protein